MDSKTSSTLFTSAVSAAGAGLAVFHYGEGYYAAAGLSTGVAVLCALVSVNGMFRSASRQLTDSNGASRPATPAGCHNESFEPR